jgi:SH3-like domain-containing protein
MKAIGGRIAMIGVLTALLSSAAAAQTRSCDAAVNVADQDPAGLNVRAAPGGAIVTALKAKGRWVRVEVTGQDGGWARIRSATLEADENDNPSGDTLWKGDGWVAFSKLGVEEFDSRARFFAAPNERAKLVLSLEGYGDKTASAEAVLGCDGEWLQVRIKGVVGWTHMWCTNQLTTCV